MTKRLRMNSQDIQRAFPEVYRDFFSQCEIVVSSHLLIPWASGSSVVYGGLGICQKMPLKVYAGLRTASSPGIKIASIQSFYPQRSVFSMASIDQHIINRVEKYLNTDFLKRYDIPKTGIDVQIVLELPTGNGLGTTGAITTAVTAALFLYFHRLDRATIQRWESLPSHELLNNPDTKFPLVYRAALLLEQSIYHFRPIGIGQFCSMRSTEYPVAIFLDRDLEREQSMPKQFGPWAEYIESLPVWGAGFHELTNTSLSAWPIKYGLISSGESQEMSHVLDSLQEIAVDTRELKKYAQQAIRKMTPRSDPSLFQHFSQTTSLDADPRERLTSLFHTLNLWRFKCLLEVFQKGYSANGAKQLFESLDREYALQNFSELTTVHFDRLFLGLNEFSRRLESELGVGSKIAGIGKRGDILFATADSEFCERLEECLEALRQKTNKPIWLDYASWIDGTAEAGLTVEQHLGERHYSAFIEPSSAILHQWHKNEHVLSVLGKARLADHRQHIDLFLDMIGHKIYVKGAALTSKDIHSAKETITLLWFLLNHLDQTVPGNDLPTSSYTSDRTALQGKITGPLIEVVDRLIGKRLPLIVSGSLGKNYTARLRPSDLEIAVLESRY